MDSSEEKSQSFSRTQFWGGTWVEQSRQLVEHFFRQQYGKTVSRLTRSLGLRDLDFAEDCVQTAMLRAIRNWAQHGVPNDAEAWLFTVARNAARDRLRRETLHRGYLQSHVASEGLEEFEVAVAADSRSQASSGNDDVIEDDQLRLIFLCADPEIPLESRLVLTLKVAAGFSVSEIARALLVSQDSVQKRITRAKERLRSQQSLSLQLDLQMVLARIEEVQLIIYLIFNEGYFSTSDQVVIRRDLCDEAIRLAGLLESTRFGDLPSTSALLALMFFHSARFGSRLSDEGVVPFEDQDRTKWDWTIIRRGMTWMTRSIRGSTISRYHIESAIAWEHCRAASHDQTDWKRIAELYQQLMRLVKAPAIQINLAYAQSQYLEADKVLEQLQSFPESASEVEHAQCDTLRAQLHCRAGRVALAQQFFESAMNRNISAAHKQSIARRSSRLEP